MTVTAFVPLKVDSVSLRHIGGTKSYYVVQLIPQAPGYMQSAVLLRWGKNDAIGVHSEHYFSTPDEAYKFEQGKIDEKAGGSGGYSVQFHKTADVYTHEDLLAVLNTFKGGERLSHRLSPRLFSHLNGIAVRAPTLNQEAANYAQLQKLERERLAAAYFEKGVADQQLEIDRLAALERQEIIKNNPNWGRF